MNRKFQENGLCESHRMMLPNRSIRNELDDQKIEQISMILQQSLSQRITVTIKMYDLYEQLEVIGIVDRVDRQSGRFKVDGEWFIMGEIEAVSIKSSGKVDDVLH